MHSQRCRPKPIRVMPLAPRRIQHNPPARTDPPLQTVPIVANRFVCRDPNRPILHRNPQARRHLGLQASRKRHALNLVSPEILLRGLGQLHPNPARINAAPSYIAQRKHLPNALRLTAKRLAAHLNDTSCHQRIPAPRQHPDHRQIVSPTNVNANKQILLLRSQHRYRCMTIQPCILARTDLRMR